mgnify:CR=1 FL=1
MLIKNYFFCFFVLLVFILNSCQQTSTPAKIFDRYIYFNVGEIDGATPEQYGFYRYSLLKDTLQKISDQSCSFITGVSQFGSIIFEKDAELEFRHWLLKEDGNIVTFPMIKTSDPGYEIVFQKPPCTALSYNGNYVAYFLRYQAIGCIDLCLSQPILVRYNIQTAKMDTILLQDSLKVFFDSSQAEVFLPVNQEIIISKEGNQMWFVMKGLKKVGNDLETVGYQIISWKDGILKSCTHTDALNPIQIRGINFATMRLILTIGETVNNFRTNNYEFNYNALKPENISNPEQIAKDLDRMVIWTKEGIEIAYPDGGGYVAKVINFNTIIQGYGAYDITSSKRLSFSPDGKKIVFALPKLTGNVYDIFVVDWDGKNLKRIMINMPLGVPVLSNAFEVK